MGMPSSSRPEDRYTELKGKTVYTSSGSANSYGKIRDIDLTNGIIVLDGRPWLDYGQQKVVRRDGVLIPLADTAIIEISQAELEAAERSLGSDFAYVGNWVRIGDNFGRLDRVNPYDYELKPFLNTIAGAYFFMETPSLRLPIVSPKQAIIPVRKEDLEAMIKESGERKELERLKTEAILKQLKS